MKIEIKDAGKVTLVVISGRMDAVTTPEYEKQLEPLLQGEAGQLLVDFGQLEYISSAGLRALLATGKRLKGKGGELLFCNLAGAVKEVFEISGFNSIFRIFDSAEDATNATI